MHSSFSGDSDAPMEDMVREAIRLGLEGICLTEHLDPDYPEIPEDVDFSLDIPYYRKKLYSLREKYKDRLQLHYGIELGLQPHLADQFHELVQREDFDFVIGSSHVVHGYDPYYPDFFRNRSEDIAYREYFESILENLKHFSDMDVYGHLDYIVRYGPNKNRDYHYSNYQDILDEILRLLIEKHVGLEVNTGGYHKGLGQPNPSLEILKRYRELGGEIVTIGADAHDPSKIAYAFDLAAEALRSCGYQYYAVFYQRRPKFLPL